LESKGFLLFDIDGVIRDVTDSYRLSIKETVYHFCKWRPTIEDIDDLKAEGCWNNDWDVSLEFIKRRKIYANEKFEIPNRLNLITIFNNFYFGNETLSKKGNYKGFIKNERILINLDFFEKLIKQNILFGFVSGAERSSINFLFKRIGLIDPTFVAMNEAPDKPDPTGLILLSQELTANSLGLIKQPIAYVGDTVADVLTVKNAKRKIPAQKFISIGIAPPHLHTKSNRSARSQYEAKLRYVGADYIIQDKNELFNLIPTLFNNQIH
tara:strand:+ start:960 stop:1760 length:801 start_codon:yes stop_codon:yes gene_type:complete